MKSSALKVSLITGLALSVLVLGGIVLIRQKPAWLRHTPQAKRYPHEHLNTSEWEPKAKVDAVAYTLRSDETLASVAALRYGHQYYFHVIKLYNHIEDEGHIETDSTATARHLSHPVGRGLYESSCEGVGADPLLKGQVR